MSLYLVCTSQRGEFSDCHRAISMASKEANFNVTYEDNGLSRFLYRDLYASTNDRSIVISFSFQKKREEKACFHPF
jgi:hypothetical protein